MTWEELREDFRKLKTARVDAHAPDLPAYLKPRGTTTQERREARARDAAEAEAAEAAAAAAPVSQGVDEEDNGHGDAKKARVNLAEQEDLRTRIIGYLGRHSGLKVNDNLEEKKWEEILEMMIEGRFEDEEAGRIFDDLTGKELVLSELRKARKEEMEFAKSLRVYEEVPITQCWESTGKAPIGTRWVDILKGELTRSRWVAQDYKKKGDNQREDLFAAMPPLKAKKALFKIGRSG